MFEGLSRNGFYFQQLQIISSNLERSRLTAITSQESLIDTRYNKQYQYTSLLKSRQSLTSITKRAADIITYHSV